MPPKARRESSAQVDIQHAVAGQIQSVSPWHGTTIPSLIGTIAFIMLVPLLMHIYFDSRATHNYDIVAHRGACEYVPEHTLEAYEVAVRMDVDYVELDLCLTADKQLICMHDIELSETTNVADVPEFAHKKTTKVMPDGNEETGFFTNDFTLAEIKQLRTKQRHRSRSQVYNDQFEVPTMAEAIQLVQKLNTQLGKNVGLYIELKQPSFYRKHGMTYDDVFVSELEAAGLQLNNKTGNLAKVIVQCFEATELKFLRTRMEFPMVQLIDEPDMKQADGKEVFAKMMTKAGLDEIATFANGIGPSKSYFLPRNQGTDIKIGSEVVLHGSEAVAYAHSKNLIIHVWTVRSRSENPPPAGLDATEEQLSLYLMDMRIDGAFHENLATAIKAREWFQTKFQATALKAIRDPIFWVLQAVGWAIAFINMRALYSPQTASIPTKLD